MMHSGNSTKLISVNFQSIRNNTASALKIDIGSFTTSPATLVSACCATRV